VWLLVGYLSHPDPGAKFLELDSSKGLGQKVGELVLGVDVVGPNAPFLQAAPDEVVPHPDVLAALMEDWILRQGQGGLAVHPELHCLCVSAKEITKQPSQPQSLSRSGSGCDVFCLAAGQSHHLLLDRLPADRTLAEEEERPAGALARVDVAGVVAVTVPDEMCRTGAPRVVQTVVGGARDVAEDPLERS